MKTATAIRKFLSTPGYNPELSYLTPQVSEIKQLKDASSPEEWKQFGHDACEALGETLEE